MTEDAPGRLWSGIDIPKTIATVLAAVSAAVIGSYLGVAGTLMGAAVASLIGTIGTEVYHNSIKRGRSKLKGTFVTAPAAVGTPPVAAVPDEPAAASPPRRIRWGRVAMVAGAVFVLAMGALTVAELLGGRSISDATGGGTGDRSTVSTLFRDSDKSDESPSSPGPSSEPTDDPTTTPPTEPPSTAPTDQPTTDPTTEPTTDPATESTTGDTSGGDTDSGSTDGGGTGGADPRGAGDTANRTR